MATFKYNGVDALDLTFEKMANLSGDDLLRIIRPGAELLRERLIEKVRAIFTQKIRFIGKLLQAERTCMGGRRGNLRASYGQTSEKQHRETAWKAAVKW